MHLAFGIDGKCRIKNDLAENLSSLHVELVCQRRGCRPGIDGNARADFPSCLRSQSTE